MNSARTILVVGATETRRVRSVGILSAAGHRVAVAAPADALREVGALAPPLVVFDLEAFDDSTTQICRRIKAEHPETFILKLAPSAPEAAGHADFETSLDAYLIDPVDPQEMSILVRSLLRLQKVEADLRTSEERLLLAQESAGLAILDWVISTNTFIHSDNFAEVFDLEPRAPGEPLSGAMLIERVHPDDLDSLLGEFSRESLTARDFEKEFRIVCRDGSVRWIQSRGRLFSGAGGMPERMLSLNYDVTARKMSERANAELAAIVASSIDAIVGIDPSGRITSWNVGADRMLGVTGGMIGRRIDDVLSGVTEGDRTAFQFAPDETEPREFESRLVSSDGEAIDVLATVAPIRAASGEVIGSSLVMRDVSQQKQREDHVRFLMRELTHRSKNLLAVIQAMARQSVSQDVTPGEFVRRFTERLAGLAGSHDLLSRVDWKGASLLELVRSQLNHYIDLFGTRILLEGEEVSIRPEAAQNIGIALHELSTNAAKYGALSNAEGRVTITWSVEDSAAPTFRLSWVESGGPTVVAPTRRGFGHVVMDRITGRALGGQSGIHFDPAGVVWALEVPAKAAIMA